jgi:hypothetical protein
LVELDKLAYAAALTPFATAGVKEYSREEVFNILKSAPDPYEKFREVAKAANAERVKLAEPWESLRMLIAPRPSEVRRLMIDKAYRELDEGKKKALFYATFALEETFGVYKSTLKEYAKKRGKAVEKRKAGERPFKQDVYEADVGHKKQLTEKEEAAFEDALKILRERLNEYAIKFNLGDLLNVEEGKARELAEAEYRKLPKFKDVSFGVKAYAALIAYREHALGRRGAFGIAAWHWLEEGGSAWLLYYSPVTACDKAERARAERPAAVEEMIAEALRRLFLKPGANYYRGFVEELTKSGRLVLELDKESKSTYVFKLYNEEGGGLKELGVKLKIHKLGERIVYTLEFDVGRGRELFRLELEAAEKTAELVGTRMLVEDLFPYMLGWPASDMAISRKRLQMSTVHLWQLAETKALFNWSYVAVRGMGLTLEGPKPRFYARVSLEKLNKAIRRSMRDGWLKTLGIKAGGWNSLKRWVAKRWDEVIDAVERRLEGVKAGHGFDLAKALEELKSLKSRLDDDKTAREALAPALLLIQAERLGVNEETLKYFGAVISGAIGGDGYVSAARREVVLTSGEREIALLWAAVFAAHGIKAKVWRTEGKFNIFVSGEDAVKLVRQYLLYGPPLLEGDERIVNHKLAEAVELAAEGLNIRWEGLGETESGLVATLTISADSDAVDYNIYLSGATFELGFQSTDRSRAELAARLLRLAGVSAKVEKVGGRDEWRITATADTFAAGREELRKALAEIVRAARDRGLMDKEEAGRWLEKLEEGHVFKEGWPKYNIRLVEGALVVRFGSTNPDSIEREAQRLENMGLDKDWHFTVKWPEKDSDGCVSILKEGLAYAAWLSVHGSGRQRELAEEFVKHILQRAEEGRKKVYEKVREIIEEGKSWGSLTLKGFEKRGVEVVLKLKDPDGAVKEVRRTCDVKVIDGSAELEKGRSDKILLRLTITAEVDGVRRDYTITYGKYGRNAAVGYAYARADAPGGKEADAVRFAAVVKALTGEEPEVYPMKGGQIMIKSIREHLDGFRRYAELADAIERWLKKTCRRFSSASTV